THGATRHATEDEEREPVVVEGKAEPVPVWRAVRAKGAYPGELEVERVTPLVGRVTELDLLHGMWTRVVSDRRPHLVTLLGPSGIGKSRVLREFAKRLEPIASVVRGRCRPYGETTG